MHLLFVGVFLVKYIKVYVKGLFEFFVFVYYLYSSCCDWSRICLYNNLSDYFDFTCMFVLSYPPSSPGGVVSQWLAHLTCNWSFVIEIPIKGSHCFHEQETLPSLVSTGWF